MELAGQPIQNISQQLNDAINKLNQINVNETRGFPSSGFNETILVPGTDARVDIRASRSGLPNASFDPNETTIYGNPEQIALIADKNKGDVFSLAWSVDGSYDNGSPRNESAAERSRRVKIARAADRGFDKAIKDLPEGSLVENSPVGAAAGDFGRADIYMQKGFGPLQNDGLQYGLVENGRIRPVSPFVVNEMHAQHLAERAKNGGNTQLSSAISKELERRKSLDLENNYVGKQPEYDDDYGYDGYDDGPPPPVRRREFENRLESGLDIPYDYSGDIDEQYPDGIDVRRRAEGVFREVDEYGRQDDLDDAIIAEGVRRVRERQLEDIGDGRNREAGANMDLLQRLNPRQLPQPISATDLDRMRNAPDDYSSLRTELPANTPRGERRDAFVNAVRNRMEAHPTGADSAPAEIRNSAKRNLIDIYEETPGGRVIAQELFNPGDVENLRQWQVNQAINWPLPAYTQRPAPPILDTQGRAMGPAQYNAHPDAPSLGQSNSFGRSTSTNAQRREFENRERNPYSGTPLATGTREVQWRANQPAENYANIDSLQGVELTPSHMRVNVVMANDRIGAMVQNGTLPVNTPRNPQQMQEFYGLQPNFDNLPQDLMRIRAFNGRNTAPSDFFDRDSAQALINLNAAQNESGNILLDSVNAMSNQSQFNIGESARIRRIQSTQPFNPNFTNPIADERQNREGRRRANRRNDRWGPPIDVRPDPFTASVRRQMEERAMQQADNLSPDPGWSLGTIRRVDPNSTRQDLDGISFAELGIDAQRRTQQRSQSPVPSGLSLDEFLDYTADSTPGNTVARAQPRESTRSGSTSAALARPENRIVRRRRQAESSADRWNTAPLVPEYDDIPF
ncbi:hypothetical protein [Synechococcus sp. WH 8016]|uniref:hypothetical protein n=1 Tax=Synechococcus sp. WH 8016 TaxID=166318 RepID=UPI0002D9B69D|nr:hypothetical protein [Synechococcus sp. WH 8016]